MLRQIPNMTNFYWSHENNDKIISQNTVIFEILWHLNFKAWRSFERNSRGPIETHNKRGPGNSTYNHENNATQYTKL